MAVYTELTASDLTEVLTAFGLGALDRFTFIPQGSINTNVRLETRTGRYFLRHTTVRSGADLASEASLLDHLREGHFPAPVMHRTLEGAPFLELRGGRACVFGFLVGEEKLRAQVTAEHCERLGAELGKLHRLTSSFTREQTNPYDAARVRGWLAGLAAEQTGELKAIAEELKGLLEQVSAAESGLLPHGVIHADLFLDNVKWVGDQVSAFFDFEMACKDSYALDLAITLNAWCFDGGYQVALCRAFLRGYQSERPLGTLEREQLHNRALFGAIRYSASRIRDFHLSPLPPEKLFKKDFRTYLARARQLAAWSPVEFAGVVGL